MASMAGTCYVDINEITSVSPIPLYFLSIRDQESVIESLQWNDQWKQCDLFCQCLADMGGLPRALETFIATSQ